MLSDANESIDLVRIMSAIGPEEKDLEGRKASIKRLIELESARWTEPLARRLFVAIHNISPKQRFASGVSSPACAFHSAPFRR